MPNHVINEVIFENITEDQRAAVLKKILDAEGKIDFGVLLPIPLNAWMGNAGVNHEKAFKLTALDWCRENWGTKWGAYDQEPIEPEENRLRLVFETAWRPPYGWLVAVFNTFQLPFTHTWLSEGGGLTVVGRFDPKSHSFDDGLFWEETEADDATHRRLHKMHWGVENFDEGGEDA